MLKRQSSYEQVDWNKLTLLSGSHPMSWSESSE